MLYCLPCTNTLQVKSIVSVDEIVTRSCIFFNTPFNKIKSRNRHRTVVEKRQMLMCLIRQNSSMSLNEIGQLFGGYDHTTVMHSIRTMKNLMFAHKEYKLCYKELESQVLY